MLGNASGGNHPRPGESQILARILIKHRVTSVSRAEMVQTLREMKLDFAPGLKRAIDMAREEKEKTPESR